MKTRATIVVLLFLLLGGPMLNAQVDFFGALQQAAEMHNESRGEEAGDGNTEMTEEEKRWIEDWKKKMEENAEILQALDDKYLKCLGLMSLYVYEYLKLKEGAENAENCKLKYDLYGMQILALTTSTTIMYCPEEMDQLSYDQRKSIWEDFREVFFQRPYYHSQRTLWIKIQFIMNHITTVEDGELHAMPHNMIGHLIGYFDPNYVANWIYRTGRKMEALGCGG